VWHFLVTIAGVGEPLRLSRSTVEVMDSKVGAIYPYRGVLSSISPPAWGTDNSDCQITAERDSFDVVELRSHGTMTADAAAEVALWEDGTDWDDRLVLLVGNVAGESVKRSRESVAMTLKEPERMATQQFPPYRVDRQEQKNSTPDSPVWIGFPDLPDSERGKALNVIYGRCSNVPLVMLDRVSLLVQGDVDTGTNQTVSYVNIVTTTQTAIRWAIAGHRIRSRTVTVRPNDNDAGNEIVLPVLYGRDFQTGMTYAYVELVMGGDADNTSSLTADVVEGYEDANGGLITGLGDVVLHALRVYSALSPTQIDWERLARFAPRANILGLSAVFGGDTSTFLDVLKGRLEAQFPISFSFRGGRLGADWEVFDWEGPHVRRLRFDYQGGDFIDRADPVEIHNQESGANRFTVEYDPDPYGIKRPGVPVFRRIKHFDHGTYGDSLQDEVRDAVNAILDSMPGGRHRAHGGTIGHLPGPRQAPRTWETVELIDVVEQATAAQITFALRDRFGVRRTGVRYIGPIETLRYLPLRERYLLTDDDMLWEDEPFRLESLEFSEDGLATALLVSFNEAA